MSYVSAVAELFENTGHADLLTGAAYTQIAEWEKEGIPLELIRSTIEDLHTTSPSRLQSFLHIAEIVEADFGLWLCKSLADPIMA